MKSLIPQQAIERKIFLIRGYKVIIDRDIAELYGVTVKALNQAVKRNKKRFPGDFIFQLTAKEKNEVVTNCDHLVTLKFSHVLPYAFTEHGALMAATVLNSPRAVEMSMYVVRAFIRMREAFVNNQILHKRLAEIETVLLSHGTCLRDLYKKIRPLLVPPLDPPKRRIGFHP
ncbi:MAG: hypothetical protein A3G33_11665 [Omnitrophica bacterium RIFCSPLOWO2_12_FULL_44_17]|uniref:KilA-N DNA-binding domain-containing protein n=1 Tax=Candidatus Danuiimicrobium aquiferis TaxID=1801832 RepID=A0A1G1KS49_9BACT|nr:MAG: hypothetical protein A3B72_09505 [Omnitrophica bacterium RIFCSPHIGHO2_02_FULL_45_28]OGW95645.1 MAG: hypothetical protein A3G33_11665 [Omnitrophica bacterium RIFCSPLOWO2_12_FULL_44_17]OGX04766.1 MAG: hypothetical protein A3J12_06040 [Omnitrophica bacterium RIFCSPLOWO2_02_FULL_44_11]